MVWIVVDLVFFELGRREGGVWLIDKEVGGFLWEDRRIGFSMELLLLFLVCEEIFNFVLIYLCR